MKTIISPAKKMVVNQESFLAKTKPDFLEQAKILADFLKRQEADRLKQIWEASDKIVQEGRNISVKNHGFRECKNSSNCFIWRNSVSIHGSRLVY